MGAIPSYPPVPQLGSPYSDGGHEAILTTAEQTGEGLWQVETAFRRKPDPPYRPLSGREPLPSETEI